MLYDFERKALSHDGEGQLGAGSCEENARLHWICGGIETSPGDSNLGPVQNSAQ